MVCATLYFLIYLKCSCILNALQQCGLKMRKA